MNALRTFVLAVVAVVTLEMSAFAAEQKVTLMLGGKFCDSYLGDVESALKKVSGVKAVDVKSMKGHAVVTADASVKPKDLVSAVNGVKGDGWHCKADLM
jgi:periplasmic mercuric ion binding protein